MIVIKGSTSGCIKMRRLVSALSLWKEKKATINLDLKKYPQPFQNYGIQQSENLCFKNYWTSCKDTRNLGFLAPIPTFLVWLGYKFCQEGASCSLCSRDSLDLDVGDNYAQQSCQWISWPGKELNLEIVIMIGASIFWAEAEYMCTGDRRGSKIFVYSWPTLRLCLCV